MAFEFATFLMNVCGVAVCAASVVFLLALIPWWAERRAKRIESGGTQDDWPDA